jgi:hypothetical protein
MFLNWFSGVVEEVMYELGRSRSSQGFSTLISHFSLRKNSVIRNLAVAASAVLTIAIYAGCSDPTGPDALVWTVVQSPAVGPVSGISGTSPFDVWALASNGIFHFNGLTWSKVQTGFGHISTDVWARTPSDVWIAGTDGIDPNAHGYPTILHYNGTVWSITSSPTVDLIQSIWGSSGSDVWAVSHSGEIAHYDGTTWTSDASQTNVWLKAVWGTSASDVWAAGDGALLHYNGSGWSQVLSPFQVLALWGTSPSDVWMLSFPEIVRHYDGSAWSTVESGFGDVGAQAVWAASPSNVWVAGKVEGPVDDTCCAKMVHYNGTSWSDVPLAENTPFITALWGSSASDVWAASRNGIYHGTR